MSRRSRPTAAVIGAGVAGLTAAHVLKRTHEVSLFESDARLGGHVHTHDVPGSDGAALRIDSGFIVHNDRAYPTLLRLFAELEVTTRPTEMSMSITCGGCGLSYAGGRGLRGILAQPWRAGDPRFVAHAHRGTPLPSAGACAARTIGGRWPVWSGRSHVGGVPPRRRLLELLRPALRDPARRLRMVRRRQGRRRLPSTSPVPFPRSPRDAQRQRLTHLANGDRRLCDVRRSAGRATAGTCARRRPSRA